MPALSYSITISDEESAYLKSLIKTRTIQHRLLTVHASCYGSLKPKQTKPLQMAWALV